MFSKIDKMSVMCMIIFVNMRVKMRYTVDNSNAAPVTNSRRYTVCLRVPLEHA